MNSSHLNNSFHYIFDKIDEGEELEDKIFPNGESCEQQLMNTISNIFEPNLSISQLQNKKKKPNGRYFIYRTKF